MKLEVSDPQVVRVDDLIVHAKEIIETLRLAAVEFEYDGIGYSVDSSGRVLQNCRSSIWTTLREGAEDATVAPDPRDEALRVAEKAMADELDRMKYDKKHRSHKDYAEVSVDELDERMGFMASAIAAIRAAGGAR